MTEPVGIAILAKAPVPGLAKTRLIPRLGADAAAALQARLIDHTLRTALAAGGGPVVLWCSPDTTHPQFQQLASDFTIPLRCQPERDLGARMLMSIEAAAAPTLVIGTDCPALTPAHLRAAAGYLARGDDAVVLPAEDGGYVLIGLRQPQPELFAEVSWGGDQVMAQTRQRLRQLGLRWSEPLLLWDVDRPDDLERLAQAHPELLDFPVVPSHGD